MIIIVLIAVLAIGGFGISGCSIIREGITGERPEEVEADNEEPLVPPAFNIVGDWFGVYSGNEYVSLRFTADGKCELQTGLFASDMFGARYYGEYRWGGVDGKDITLDMYRGLSKEVDYGGDNKWDEWYDGGHDASSTALVITFSVFGGTMRSVAIKADIGGIDTDGYTVVERGAFLVLMSTSYGGDGNGSPFIFGSHPYDESEGKTLMPSVPNAFLGKAERFYTTAELNVRCGPATTYGTYGTVPLGTPADKIGYMTSGHDDWAFVLINDGGGWMNTDYLATSPPKPEPDED